MNLLFSLLDGGDDPRFLLRVEPARRVSLGWYRDLTPNFRVTTEYDFLRVEGADLENTYGVEAQLRF